MKIELINQTNSANIYGVYENNLKPVGTVEIKLIGPDCGTHAYSLTGKYSKKDILRFYNENK